jgi:hypothetical protein
MKKTVVYQFCLGFISVFLLIHNCGAELREMSANPPPALVQLMNIVTEDVKDWTWEEMNTVAQKDFLRPKGKERWEIVLNPYYETKKSTLMPLLRKLGLIDEIRPTQRRYDYIIINGATVFRMRNRIEWFQKIWRQGIKGKKIIFLTGERPLDPNVEGDCVLYPNGMPADAKRPCTEVEAAKLVWDQTITLPDLRAQSVEYVVVPMKKDPITQKEVRPNAGDVIQQWLKTKPEPGHILYVINNPYIPHQHRVFAKILETYPGLVLETAGPAAGDNSMTNHLDNIARCIYTQVKGI